MWRILRARGREQQAPGSGTVRARAAHLSTSTTKTQRGRKNWESIGGVLTLCIEGGRSWKGLCSEALKILLLSSLGLRLLIFDSLERFVDVWDG